MAAGTGRVRDPERRERILAAAADLIAQRGYLGVSLGEIGAAAGIVGSGIYRHFDTKIAILVELFDRVVDRLVVDAEATSRTERPPETALAGLVRGQVHFTLTERALCEVYVQEARNLPEQDLRRLRWKQRYYVDVWQRLLCTIDPELGTGQAQVRVRAAIGSVHSVLTFHAQLEGAELAAALEAMACRVLGIVPNPVTAAADAAPDVESVAEPASDSAAAG